MHSWMDVPAGQHRVLRQRGRPSERVHGRRGQLGVPRGAREAQHRPRVGRRARCSRSGRTTRSSRASTRRRRWATGSRTSSARKAPTAPECTNYPRAVRHGARPAVAQHGVASARLLLAAELHHASRHDGVGGVRRHGDRQDARGVFAMSSPLEEIDDVFEELETLLKNPDVGAALTDKGVNTSLAMLAMDGLARVPERRQGEGGGRHDALRGRGRRAREREREGEAVMTWAKTLPAGRAHGHPEPISGARVQRGRADARRSHRDDPRSAQAPVARALRALHRVDEVAEAIRDDGRARRAGDRDRGGVRARPRVGARTRSAARGGRGRCASARPTAVNLAWALDDDDARRGDAIRRTPNLAEVARAYHADDVAACKRIGALGAQALPEKCTVLTHCNAGALATGGYGTALGVIRAAIAAGKDVRVLACETRPYLQGARLTAWELTRDRIPVDVIDGLDGRALHGARRDRRSSSSARIASRATATSRTRSARTAPRASPHAHGVPFYVAAPWSTVDLACPTAARHPDRGAQPRTRSLTLERRRASRPRASARETRRSTSRPRGSSGNLHRARRAPPRSTSRKPPDTERC